VQLHPCAPDGFRQVQQPAGPCGLLPLHSHVVDAGDRAEKSEKSDGSDTFARKEATELFGDSLVFVGKGLTHDLSSRPATGRGTPTTNDSKAGVAPMAAGQIPVPDVFDWFPGLSKAAKAAAPPPPSTPPPPQEVRTPRGHNLSRFLVPPLHFGNGTKRSRLSARKSPSETDKSVKPAAANDKRSSAERAGGTRVMSRVRQLMGSMVETPRSRARQQENVEALVPSSPRQ
jgi:hypothetical protein